MSSATGGGERLSGGMVRSLGDSARVRGPFPGKSRFRQSRGSEWPSVKPFPARGRTRPRVCRRPSLRLSWLGRLCGLALALLACGLPGQFAWAQDAPTVVEDGVTFASRPASGDTYRIGESIEVNVAFNVPVFVRPVDNELPELELSLDSGVKTAILAGGSGTTTLLFRYTVIRGDFDTDGVAIAGGDGTGAEGSLLRGIIESRTGTAAVRTFPGQPPHPSHKVNALESAEEMAFVEVVSTPAQGGTYGVGEFIDLHVVFPEPVFVRRAGAGPGCSDAAILPVLQVTLSESSPRVPLYAGSGTNTLWFRYEVEPGNFDEDGISISAGQIPGQGSLIGGCIENVVGAGVSRRFRAIPAQTSHRVDGVAPNAQTARIASRPVGTRYGIGEAIEIEVAFSEVVYVADASDLVLSVGVGSSTRQATYVEGSGTNTLLFTYIVARGDRDDDGIDIGPDALVGGAIQDVAGNVLEEGGEEDRRRRLQPVPAQAAHRVNATLDAAAPRVDAVEIVSTPTGAAYSGQEVVQVEVRFNEIVHVSGAVQLALSVGSETRNAAYLTGSGSRTLTFAYVIAAGDFDGDGIAVGPGSLALEGGEIEDAAGNEADRHFSGLPANADHLVDARIGVAATVAAVRVVSQAQPPYRAGDAIDVEVQFRDVVHVGGTPQLTLLVGGVERQARLLRGSGTTTLVFSYVVQVGDVDDDGISIASSALTGGTITDRGGRAAATGFLAIPAQPQHMVDAQSATVRATEIVSDPGLDRIYRTGDQISIRVSFSEPVLVSGDVGLVLRVGAASRLALLVEGSGTDTLTFVYQVVAGDLSQGVSIPADAVTGGLITDIAGNEAVRSSPGLPANEQHAVRGTVPSVLAVRVVSDPGVDQTYAPGEAIFVAVLFDAEVHVSGSPLLTLLIGGVERPAPLFDGSGTTTLVFRYVVQEGEYDGDGISINDLSAGTIADAAGNDAVRRFPPRREPNHRVGAEFLHVLDPITVEVGSETRIDIRAALEEAGVNFAGRFQAPVTDDASIAGIRVVGHVVTVVAVSEGVTAVAVTAAGIPLTVAVPVRVEVSVAERAVVESGMAAIGRGLLASQTDTVGRRLELARRGSGARGYRANATGQGPGWNGTGVLNELSGNAPAMPGHRMGSAAAGGGFDEGIGGHPRGHGHRHGIGPTDRTGGGIPHGRIFSMDLTGSPSNPVSWGIWAGADSQNFKGELGVGDYDGSMQSVHVGIDAKGRDWVAGASVSRARADVPYTFSTDGTGVMETQLNSISPYVQWSPNERTVVWTVLGLGSGEAFARRAGAEDATTPANLSSRLGLVGGRMAVARAGGLDIALHGDAGMVQLSTDEGLKGIDGLAVNAQRFRAGVEASWPIVFGSGQLEPFVDIGGRWDGGDGATGGGAELAGGLRYRGPLAGFELRGRSLVHHEMAGTEESGIAATFFVEPDPQGRGWRLSLSPRRGAAEWTDRFSRASGMFAAPLRRELRQEWQWQTRIGYGFALQSRPGTLTPFSELDTSGPGGQRTRLGIAYEAAGSGTRGLRLEALSERVTAGIAREAEQRILLTAEARF